jgi:hypothetical protein
VDFTVHQFIEMFQRYNEAIWPLQLVAYAIGLFIVAVFILRCRGSRSVLASPVVTDRLVPALLAGFWAWMGVVFMWGYQADISASGRVFGWLFLIGAACFAYAALRGVDLGLGQAPSRRLIIAGAMVVYAMLIYPLLGALAGHAYPEGPLFGVAPCPSAIFTLAVLVACLRPRWYLLLVPIAWAFIGATAAVKLGIVEDHALIAAALVTLIVAVWMPRRRQRGGVAPAQGS